MLSGLKIPNDLISFIDSRKKKRSKKLHKFPKGRRKRNIYIIRYGFFGDLYFLDNK